MYPQQLLQSQLLQPQPLEQPQKKWAGFCLNIEYDLS
jgi:hypothetical protein